MVFKLSNIALAACLTLSLATMARAESKTLDAFDTIYDGTSIETTVTSSSDYGYDIDSPPDGFEAKVTGTDLKITYKGSGSGVKLTIRIPAGKLKQLQVSGSGNKIVDGTVATDSFSYRSSNSGKVQISGLVSTSLSAEVSGSGTTIITSVASKPVLSSVDYQGSGSQAFYVGGLIGTASTKLSGSGDFYVAGTDNTKITGTYWGSGKVHYDKGSCSVSGSGKCVKESVTIPASI